MAVVPPGTHMPGGARFERSPTGQTLQQQAHWEREGAQKVERIEGMAAERTESAGREEPVSESPAEDNLWDSPAATRIMDAIAGDREGRAAAQDPPPMPDRGGGHAPGGGGQQQERSAPAR